MERYTQEFKAITVAFKMLVGDKSPLAICAYLDCNIGRSFSLSKNFNFGYGSSTS